MLLFLVMAMFSELGVGVGEDLHIYSFAHSRAARVRGITKNGGVSLYSCLFLISLPAFVALLSQIVSHD